MSTSDDSPIGLAWASKTGGSSCLKGVLWRSHRRGYRHFIEAPAEKKSDSGRCEAGYHDDATIGRMLCNGSTICDDCAEAMQD